MEPKILVKPTEKQYQVLQDAFDYFNEALFKDSLPQVMLTLNRERNTFGYYVPSIWIVVYLYYFLIKYQTYV